MGESEFLLSCTRVVLCPYEIFSVSNHCPVNAKVDTTGLGIILMDYMLSKQWVIAGSMWILAN